QEGGIRAMDRADTWIGRAMRRREDPRLITGHGRYAADNRPDGLVHMAVARAGMPRARVVQVDLESARAMPGVIGVWTAADLGLSRPTMPEGVPVPDGMPGRPVLAADHVQYAGDALAVVAAETEYQARDAAEAVFAELEPADADHQAAGTVSGGFGDAEAAFTEAPVVVSEHLRMGKICGAAM